MVIEGTIQATGKSYVPIEAYVFVNLTQVQLNEKEVTTAVANTPAAKATDVNGSDANVKGEGSMNILPETMNIGRTYQLWHVTNTPAAKATAINGSDAYVKGEGSAAKVTDVNGGDANVKGEGSMNLCMETMNIGRTYQLWHVTN